MTERISTYREELETQMVAPRFASIYQSYNGNPFHENRYASWWKRMGDDEFDKAFRYLALVDGVGRDDTDELAVASVLGLLEYDVRDNEVESVYAVTTTPEVLEAAADSLPGLHDALTSLSVIYDSSKHPELAMREDAAWKSTLATYSGDIPENVAYFACRNRTIGAANAFWRSDVVVNKTRPTQTLKKIGGLKKSENLINAMLMGHERTHLTQRKGVVPDNSKDLLARVEYTSSNLPEEVRASTKALNMFEDLSPLWQSALRYSGIAMTFENSQDELLDEKALRERFEELSKFTCMEEYLDAYLAGVPANDILV